MTVAFPRRCSSASRIVALETKWQRLNREVKDSRERAIKLEQREFKAILKTSSGSAQKGTQLSIIDPAYLPTRPSGAGRGVIVIGGVGVAIVIGGLLMLALGFVDDRVYDRLDLERLKMVDVLIEVPKASRKERRQVQKAVKARVKAKPAPKG